MEIVFLDVELDELRRRVAERNRNLPAGTFSISPEELDEWVGGFEPPTDEELAGRSDEV